MQLRQFRLPGSSGFRHSRGKRSSEASRSRRDKLYRSTGGGLAKAANYLGIGLANLVNIFNPELIVIGGGLSKMGDMLLEPARKVVKERAFQLPARTVRIIRARLGSNAGIVGAAVHTFEQQLDRNTEA